MVKDNHALRFLANRRGRGIPFGFNQDRLLLIPEAVFAEHRVGQMLRQPSGLEYFNLKAKEGPVSF